MGSNSTAMCFLSHCLISISTVKQDEMGHDNRVGHHFAKYIENTCNYCAII